MLEYKLSKRKDLAFLYRLLKKRPKNENISHKEMPTKKQHNKFYGSKPYKYWVIITLKNKPIGSIYHSYKDEIGFHVLPKYKRYEASILKDVLKSHKKKTNKWFFNVSVNHKRRINLYNKYLNPLQKTYEI